MTIELSADDRNRLLGGPPAAAASLFGSGEKVSAEEKAALDRIPTLLGLEVAA